MPVLVLQTVNGLIKRPNGTNWGDASIKFVPNHSIFGGGITVPVDSVEVFTAADGTFSTELETFDGSYVRYHVYHPSGEIYEIDVFDNNGVAYFLDTLLAAQLLNHSDEEFLTNVLINYINARIPLLLNPNPRYVHTQYSPSNEWTVNHNLGERPNVEVRTTGGAVIDADVLHTSANQFKVFFSYPTTGEARCL